MDQEEETEIGPELKKRKDLCFTEHERFVIQCVSLLNVKFLKELVQHFAKICRELNEKLDSTVC